MPINVVVLAGNLTREPEVRETSAGKPVAVFSVAVNDRVKVNGEWTNRPNYIDVVTFTGSSVVEKYLHKGSHVSIKGRLHWSQWEKNGQKRSKVEVIAEEIEFDGKPRETEVYSEDIPF